MSQTLNLNAILQQTKTRWLKTNEIYTILLNISTTNLKEMALLKLPYQPCSGEVFIIDGATPNKKWKNDGYSYLPRKTGIGFREDIEKLKIAGIKVGLFSLAIKNLIFQGNNLLLFLYYSTNSNEWNNQQ